MRKLTMIVGVPCVGKSALVNALLATGTWEVHRLKWTPFHFNRDLNLAILGLYDDETQKYPGTDRLSMGAQPKVLDFIWHNPTTHFMFEGDRLGNIKMYNELAAKHADLKVMHVTCLPETLTDRRANEREDQDEVFVRSRHTKIDNLVAAVRPEHLHTVTNDNTFAGQQNVKWLLTRGN